MNLSPAEQQEFEWSQEVKRFLESDAWNQYCYPNLVGMIMTEFPDPKNEGWEEEYRKAFALNQAIQNVSLKLQNLASRAEGIKKQKEAEAFSIEEA